MTGPAHGMKVCPQSGVKGQLVERGVTLGDPQEVAGAQVGKYCEEDLGGHVEQGGGLVVAVMVAVIRL